MVSWQISVDPRVSDEAPEKPTDVLHVTVSLFLRQPERNYALAKLSPAPLTNCSFSQRPVSSRFLVFFRLTPP